MFRHTRATIVVNQPPRLSTSLESVTQVPVFFAAPRVVLAVRVEDVLLLRDPGGEDVRVAMVMNLGQSHTSHLHHRCVSPQRIPTGPVRVVGGW